MVKYSTGRLQKQYAHLGRHEGLEIFILLSGSHCEWEGTYVEQDAL